MKKLNSSPSVGYSTSASVARMSKILLSPDLDLELDSTLQALPLWEVHIELD